MKCKCTTVAHSILGDGCDECQPQNAIEDLKEQVTELEAENKRLREEDLAPELFAALSGMLTFYGMDLDKTHIVQKLCHEKAEAACDKFRAVYSRINTPKQLLNNEGV